MTISLLLSLNTPNCSTYLYPSLDRLGTSRGALLAEQPELMYMYVNGRTASSRLVGPVSWLVQKLMQHPPTADASCKFPRRTITDRRVRYGRPACTVARSAASGFADPQGPKQESGRLKPPGFDRSAVPIEAIMDTPRVGSGSQVPVSGCCARLVSLAYNHGYRRNPNCPLCWRSNPSGQANGRYFPTKLAALWE